MGKIPDDLPDSETSVSMSAPFAALPAVKGEVRKGTELKPNKTGPVDTRGDHSPSDATPVSPSPTIESDESQLGPATVRSNIPALDHLPTPPVHFPLPHLRGVLKGSLEGPVGNPPSHDHRITPRTLLIRESPHSTAAIPTEFVHVAPRQTSPTTATIGESSAYFPVPPRSDPHGTRPSADQPTAIPTPDDTEFGVWQLHPLHPSSSSGSSSLPKGSPRGSGVVLAMRNRFSQNVSYNRCAPTISKLRFVVCLFGPVERGYNPNPSPTCQCVNNCKSIPAR